MVWQEDKRMIITKTYSNILVHFRIENEQELNCPNVIYIFTIEGDNDLYWYVGQSHYGIKHRLISHCSDCWRRNDNNKKSNVMRKYKELTVKILYKCRDIYEMDIKERELIQECYIKHGSQCLNTILRVGPKGERFTVKDIDAQYQIEQYDLRGKYLQTFASIREAAYKTGICRNIISRAVNGTAKTAGGFQWKRKNDAMIIGTALPHCSQIISTDKQNDSSIIHQPNKYKHTETTEDKKRREQESKGLKIIQYDLNGKVVAEYPSLREAERQTSVNVKAISNCCKGVFAQSKGFQFRYKNSFLPVGTNLKDKSTQTKEFNIHTKGIAIAMYDKNMRLVYQFESVNQARKKFKLANIYAHLNTNIMWHNYYWHTV